MALDIAYGSTSTGVKTVQHYYKKNRASQKWRIEPADNEGKYFKLINVKSNKCLEVARGSSSNMASIRLASKYIGKEYQQWRVVPANLEDKHFLLRILDELFANPWDTLNLMGQAIWGGSMEGRANIFVSLMSTITGDPWKPWAQEAYEDPEDRKYAELDFVNNPEDSAASIFHSIVSPIWMVNPGWYDSLSPEMQERFSVLVHQKSRVLGPYNPTQKAINKWNYNPDDFDDEAWFYINGINVDKITADKNGVMLANNFGRRISLIFNPTDGIFADLVECGLTRNLHGTIDYSIEGLPESVHIEHELVNKPY